MTEEELNEVRQLIKELRDLETLRRQVNETAQSLVPRRDGTRSSAKSHSSRVEQIALKLIRIAEREEEIKNKIYEAQLKLTKEICAAAMTPREREVLLKRYVQGKRFRDICEEMILSDARIYQLHRAGLEKITGGI